MAFRHRNADPGGHHDLPRCERDWHCNRVEYNGCDRRRGCLADYALTEQEEFVAADPADRAHCAGVGVVLLQGGAQSVRYREQDGVAAVVAMVLVDVVKVIEVDREDRDQRGECSHLAERSLRLLE